MLTIPESVKDDDVFTVREAAKLLGLSVSGVKHHIHRAGRLRVRRKQGHITITGKELRRLAAMPLASGVQPAKAKTRLTIEERRVRLLVMRDKATPLGQIAKELGYSDITAVSRAIRRAQNQAPAPASEPSDNPFDDQLYAHADKVKL